MAKETIYIEADDEITTVIEKMLSAKDAIVAVVLPKRSTVFQSLVNMKLLNKAAEEAKKKVVLISSEPVIASIAAVAGVYIAQSLNSKPVIPKRSKTAGSMATISSSELDTVDSIPTVEPEDVAEDSIDKPEVDDDTIELDNTTKDPQELAAGTLAASATEEAVKKKKRLPKIPDFGSFQVRLWLGGLLIVLLGVGWFFGFVVMPKAVVTINTDTSTSTVNFEFIAQTAATELDTDAGVVPATIVEITKENKATVPATGEKNIGEKATGTMLITNCNIDDEDVTVASGTAFSSGGISFYTVEDITVAVSNFTGGGVCKKDKAASVGVVAAQSGSSYNLASKNYTTSNNDLSATGSEMTGGTDAVVKVVSAQDIENAKTQLKGQSNADATDDLKKELASKQLQAIIETLSVGEPAIKSSSSADTEATEVTVTQTVTYQMLGIKSSDLGTLLDFKITELLKDDQNKNVRNNGLESAVYALATKTSPESQTILLQTVATIGAEFDENAIRSEIAGKKRGDIEKLLEAREGVKSVSVEYKPFWITTTPKSANKITISVNEVDN